MNITRQKLYALGEPLGDSATRRKLGGGIVCGGGGSSSSSASTTYNTDKRLVVGNEAIGVSADNSSVSLNITDGGAVDRALQTVDLSNAIAGDGYAKLIDTARDLFSQSQGLIGQTQKSVADAYSQAKTDTNGAIDNRTITVLAVAGVAAVFAFNRKK